MRNVITLSLLLAAANVLPQSTGIRYFEDGHHKKAKSYFLTYVKNNPSKSLGHYYLGRSYYELGDYDEALDHIDEAIDINSKKPDYHYWRGRVYVELVNDANMINQMRYARKMKASFERTVELDPNHIQGHAGLTNYHINAPSIAGGSKSEALKHANIVRKLDPSQGYLLLGILYEEQEEYDKAEAEYKKLVGVSKQKEAAYYRLAFFYQTRKRYNDAYATFLKSIEINPDYMPSYYQYARTSVFAKKNLDKSIGYLRKYLEHDVEEGHPDHASALWRMGNLYEIKGRKDLARKAYLDALKKDPDNENARDALDSLD